MLADEQYQNFWIRTIRWVGITWFSKLEKAESKGLARGKNKKHVCSWLIVPKGASHWRDWLPVKMQVQVGLQWERNSTRTPRPISFTTWQETGSSFSGEVEAKGGWILRIHAQWAEGSLFKNKGINWISMQSMWISNPP